MTAKALMLSALINQVYKGSDSLKEFFPSGIELTEFHPPNQKAKRGSNLSEWIAAIHYSWIEPFMAKVPESLKPYMASALTEAVAAHLKIKRAFVDPAVVHFFEKELFAQLAGPDILPFSLIPTSELDPLLFMNKARVVHLIDLLGIQDIALDFKKVIDKDLQLRLAALLTPLQKQYLNYVIKEEIIPLQQSKPGPFWLDHKNPAALIHSAGLWRLTRLVGGEEKSWQWYFMHYLDKGRGLQMQKWIEEDKGIALQGKARDKVLEQVLRLVEALK